MTSRVTRLRPNVPLHALAAALPVLGLLAMIGGLASHAWNVATAGAALVFFGRLPSLFVSEKHALVSRETITLDADESGLVIDGKERIAASEIREAVMWPNAGRRPTVRVSTGAKLPALEVEVETWDEGVAILRAIGWDAGSKAVTFRTLIPKLMTWGQISLAVIPLGVFGVFRALGHDLRGPELVAWLFSSLALGVSAIRLPRHMEVRPDGLSIRALGRARFVPWSEVESITRSFNSGTLKLRSGKTIQLRGGVAATTLPEGQRGDDALTERVIEAFEASRAREPAVAKATVATESALPSRVTVIHARTWAWIAAFSAFGAAFVPLILARGQHWTPWVAGVALSVGFVLQIFASLRPNRLVEAPVTAQPDGLVIGDKRVVRGEIENAYVQPPLAAAPPGQKVYRTHPRVVFTGRKRRDSIEVLVEDEAQGNALLRALALDPSHAVATFTGRAGIVDNAVAQVVLFAVLTGGWRFARYTHGAARYALVAATLLAAVNALWPTKIKVGADGVLVRTLRSRRFYAYADIDRLETTSKGAVLVLKSGRRVAINTTTVGAQSNTRDAFVKRVTDGLAAASRSSEAIAGLLARGERTTHEWLAALRALGAGQASSYRDASLDPKRLWAVIEDASAAPAVRASAAAAVRVADPEAAERLRAAASASASPKLRVALEAAAASDDALLARALAECAEEESLGHESEPKVRGGPSA